VRKGNAGRVSNTKNRNEDKDILWGRKVPSCRYGEELTGCHRDRNERRNVPSKNQIGNV
jgi:hypothetical protein